MWVRTENKFIQQISLLKYAYKKWELQHSSALRTVPSN